MKSVPTACKRATTAGQSGPTAGERADLQLVRKKKRITDLKSRSLVKKLERRRAGASNIVTRDRRESCEEAAVLRIIQVVNSQSGEVVITVPTVGFQ